MNGMTESREPLRIYFDANPLIYAIEGDDGIAKPVRQLFDYLKLNRGIAVTSELTLAEVLPKAAVPHRRSYLDLIVWSGLFDLRPITRDILIETADYRRTAAGGRVGMPKLPDSIHIVTAIHSQCRIILSSDLRMKLPDGFSVIAPDSEGLSRLIQELP